MGCAVRGGAEVRELRPLEEVLREVEALGLELNVELIRPAGGRWQAVLSRGTLWADGFGPSPALALEEALRRIRRKLKRAG